MHTALMFLRQFPFVRKSFLGGPSMRLILLLMVCCFSPIFTADGQVLNQIANTKLNQAISGDFNGDGQTDFVFVSSSSQGHLVLTTYMGRGDGFITGIKRSFLSIDSSVAVPPFSPNPAADFNGDGKPDIAFLTNKPSGQLIFISYGNGDGTFENPQQVNYSGSATNLTVIDLNNDHHPDLLFETGSNIVALFSNSDGTFQPPVLTPINGWWAVGDVNNDGYPDLLLGNYEIALGDGQGHFVPTGKPADLGLPTESAWLSDEVAFIGMQDLNGDKYGDLLFTLSVVDSMHFTVTNSLILIPGNGDGTFGAAQNPNVSLDGKDQNGNGISYFGVLADFYQNGHYEALLFASPSEPAVGYCCQEFVPLLSFDGSANGGWFLTYLPQGSIDYLSSGTLLPVVFSRHQVGVVDQGGSLYLLSNGSAAIYLSPYFIDLGGVAANATIGTTLGYEGTDSFMSSSVTAKPPISISNFTSYPGYSYSAPNYTADISFSSNQEGPFSGVVSINSNASSALNLPVFTYVGTASLNVTPASLDFGVVKAGSTSTAQQITVTNVSETPAYAQFAVTAPFQETATTCNEAIATSCSISLVYAPSRAGSSIEGLKITDQNGFTASVSLKGLGYSTGPILMFGVTEVTFPDQQVGTSGEYDLQLKNTGDLPLIIQSMAVAAPFAVQTACSTIQPGSSCLAHLTFSPTSSGSLSQPLTVSSNASNGTQTIQLTGVGFGPAFSASPTSLDFGYQKSGTTSPAQQVTLTNISTQSASVIHVLLQGPFAETNTCHSEATAGATCSVSVTASPTGAGQETGSVTIIDQNNASVVISLKVIGYSQGPIAKVAPPAVAFGNQPVYTSSNPAVVTLSNNGDAPLQVQTIAVDGNSFQESTTCGSSLQPGGTCAVQVTFTPENTGKQSGTLTITDNAASSPQIVTLTGSGKTALPLQFIPVTPCRIVDTRRQWTVRRTRDE